MLTHQQLGTSVDDAPAAADAEQARGPLRIAVIGTGYLGAVHAACMAYQGHSVVAVDADAGKAAALAAGRPPFFEPGLEELLAEVAPTGRLTFTTDYALTAGSDVFFLCVGTPQQQGGYAADTTYVYAAARSVAPYLTSDSLVVGKSTVPIGTAAAVRDTMAALAPAGVTVRLVWNPEFLREGVAIQDTLHPDRFVYGVQGPTAEADIGLLDRVYATSLADGTPRVVTDYVTAEMVKTAANSFLATKISFINAMAEICESAGGDVVKLAEAIGHDERIGRKFLGAGVGFGGGCLPKDIRAFRARAEELGLGQSLAFLHEVDGINQRRRDRVVDLVAQLSGGGHAGVRVAILGAAFKPHSDDVRDSPALSIAAALQDRGAHVRVFDPKAMPNAKHVAPQLQYAADMWDACADADVVAVLTEWPEFRTADPVALANVVRRPVIIDGRNALPGSAWTAAGWTYHALGRAAAASALPRKDSHS